LSADPGLSILGPAIAHHLPVGSGKLRLHGPVRAAATSLLVLGLLASGCRAGSPAVEQSGDVSPGAQSAASTASTTPSSAPAASSTGAPPTVPVASAAGSSSDPIKALTGLGTKALGPGGVDAVMRIGAGGFLLPDREHLSDLHGDRVLAVRPGIDGAEARLVVRSLDGALVREIPAGMQIPQAAIVRHDDVYFAGVDLAEDSTDFGTAMDRGVWVARGGTPPELVLEGTAGLAVYEAIERSPDGKTLGIWRCGEICSTILIGPGGDVVEVPKPGLIALTNDVALLIGAFSDVTAYAVDDGEELWRAETKGAYYGRYATTDGGRIVLGSVGPPDEGGGGSTDELRIELLDAETGKPQRVVRLSTAEALSWLQPSLSTNRYVALLADVLPSTDRPEHRVRVVDLDEGRLLGVELFLGGLPGG
jgi:hypothetical protein